jgi:uncharacterized cupredoxin-like copper-binding protein
MTPRQIGIGAIATVLLAAASTLTVAAAQDRGRDRSFTPRDAATCASPALPGTVVDVSLIDMNGMGAMMGLGRDHSRSWHPAMMRIALTTGQAPAGQVSLRATNTGVIAHELVVLPLAPGQSLGNRTVGSDGTVDETGSLAEVSATCAAGTGEGLAPGSTGWTTLQLSAGRYELVCNLPGHYAAGMRAELDVS